MKVEIIPCLKDNYSYLLIDEINNTSCIIDPGEATPIVKFLNKNNIKLDFILNTHHHYDHVGGNKELKEMYGAKVVGYIDDKKRIPEIDTLLKDGQEFKIGNLNVKTIFIPGHTSGHIAFYFEKEKVVFTGDTLFSLGCGRVFEGTYQQMFESLNKIKNLPVDTKIYCGHEYTKNNLGFCIKFNPNNKYLKDKEKMLEAKIKDGKPTIPSTIKEEIQTNIFLRYNDVDVKDALNLKNASDLEIFTKLRDLKDNF